jgi:hypothetical protein
MPLDYSKWDKIDDSDDDEEAKPASPKKVAAAREGNMRAREERAHERANSRLGLRAPPSLPMTGARRAGGGGG